jgi:iron complex outermembrane receptor protein
MKTRLFAMIWAVVLSVPSSYSQHSIKGTIKTASGENLPGASVVIADTYQGTYTDKDGAYELSGFKPGTYPIIVSHIGYVSLIRSVIIKDDDFNFSVSLELDEHVYEEVLVTATLAGHKTPTTYSNLKKSQIVKANYGQDMPFLFDNTPSTVVTSDAGAGVGYTGIRIRGVDPTRTNVTINGIPLNDSESHGVYWVNMPDFASSTDQIQIQRGVGTSTNGAAAFGASINIQTNKVMRKPYAVLDNMYGSFATLRNTIKAGTGLINDQFTIDFRLSNIQSKGYIQRSSSNLRSFYVSGAWLGKKSVIRANIFMGREKTYQAWYGTPESVMNGNLDSITAYADRNWIFGEDRDNLLNSGRKYNYYTYENEVDNYGQDHYQLHFLHSFNSKLNLSIAGHYTRGQGYYEQFKTDEDFSTYGFDPIIVGATTINTTDLIRRRWLDNDFYGTVFALDFDNKKGLNLTFGGSGNAYKGGHFGEVIWAEYSSQSDIRDRYYDNNAFKMEVASYVKGTYELGKLTAYADVQYRHVDYEFEGLDEENGVVQPINDKVSYDFINPKIGVMYDFNDRHNVYASFAMANREPVRSDFIESTSASRPSHEELQDIEVGYRMWMKKVYLNATYYFMNYKNQLILTGQINDVGAYSRTNVDKSFRTGVEIDGGVQISKMLSMTANLTLSENKIPNFIQYVDDYDNGGQLEYIHSNSDLAFSPNIISSIGLSVEPLKNLFFTVTSKYVGQQFLDNTSNENRKIDAYFKTNLRLDYTIREKLFKEINIGFAVNNVFNALYANNGYTWGYVYGGQEIHENFYYPQAGINFMTRLTLKM